MATNPYVNKVELADGTTLIDLTSDTVTAGIMLPGYTAHSASGASITGNMTGVTITAPASGTNSFSITVPNGSGTITFVFNVDSSRNVTVTES